MSSTEQLHMGAVPPIQATPGVSGFTAGPGVSETTAGPAVSVESTNLGQSSATSQGDEESGSSKKRKL